MPSLSAASPAEAEPKIAVFPHFRYFLKTNVGWLALLASSRRICGGTEGDIIERWS
jgi:hypothetical protein